VVFQSFAQAELWHLSGFDLDGCASAWVSASASSTFANCESAEDDQANGAPFFERLLNGINNGFIHTRGKPSPHSTFASGRIICGSAMHSDSDMVFLTLTKDASMFVSMQPILSFLCRVLLAIIFIVSGFNKVTGFDNSVAYILSKGLPMPELGAAAAAALELVGAAALIVGWRTHWAALGLAIYCVLTAYFFHGFWAVPDAQVAGQTIQFLKNIAMTGGFFGIMAWGAGPWSLDAQQTVQAQTKEIE